MKGTRHSGRDGRAEDEVTDITQTQSMRKGDPGAGGRVLLIACGALAKEILEIKRLNGWSHLDLTCLPADLHLYPEKIPERVEAVVREHRESHSSIFVVYADCGTGGLLRRKCEELGVGMVDGPHCYSFFEGNRKFSEHAEDEATAFYLTDFLVRQFDSFVWRPLGLDRHPELRDMYFGNYDRLIYLAQTEDPSLDRLAKESAARLGLAYERRFTGYGDLFTVLSGVAAGRPELVTSP